MIITRKASAVLKIVALAVTLHRHDKNFNKILDTQTKSLNSQTQKKNGIYHTESLFLASS